MTQGHIRIRQARPSVGLTRGIHCKMIISVLPHSSRSKAVCVQNVICLLKSLCATLKKSCATLTKQQVMATDESVDTKIYGRVCRA